MTDLVVYGTPVSPFVRKVEAVLRTQGVAYDFENINIMDMPDWFLERTVALMDSGADNWEQKPYLPIYDAANWFADGERFELPDDFYSSRFLIDKTIEFIDSNLEDGKPFFAYVPFQAVHIPVQAPQEFIDRYMGVYDEGWDVLRESRQQRAVEVGLVPESAGMVRMQSTVDWESLSSERKRYEAKRMAVYAGMIEAMDFHIGRLIDYLNAQGVYENTVFIFLLLQKTGHKQTSILNTAILQSVGVVCPAAVHRINTTN